MTEHEFQFHKVRLKGRTGGANLVSVAMFQFHKVRLKDSCYKKLLHPDQSFQFHKVRLKGKNVFKSCPEKVCFNSIRYD